MKTNLSEIPPLDPPFWCLNGHIHTIGCSLLGDSRRPPAERLEISTPDGDFLELDVINFQNEKPAIALFHGLEGSTDRYYMIELINRLTEMEYSSVGVNFRSCGSRMNRKRRFYHSGETSDYHTVFKWMQRNFPHSVLGAVGFSLGANALVKSLGEEKEHHPVKAAAAVSVPYDLKEGSVTISKGFNRIYEYRFMRTLKKKLQEKRKLFPDLPTFTGSTLYEFDNQVTSKIHGFKDAEDYYSSCSAMKFIPGVRRPTLLVHSMADPLCPVEGMPIERIQKNQFLKYVITREGGHVGFRDRSAHWLNNIIVGFFREKL